MALAKSVLKKQLYHSVSDFHELDLVDSGVIEDITCSGGLKFARSWACWHWHSVIFLNFLARPALHYWNRRICREPVPHGKERSTHGK
jgi:hypothetical protein